MELNEIKAMAAIAMAFVYKVMLKLNKTGYW